MPAGEIENDGGGVDNPSGGDSGISEGLRSGKEGEGGEDDEGGEDGVDGEVENET